MIYDPTAVRGLVLNLSPTNGRYQSNDWITQKHVTHRPFMGRWMMGWKIRGLPATGIYGEFGNKTKLMGPNYLLGFDKINFKIIMSILWNSRDWLKPKINVRCTNILYFKRQLCGVLSQNCKFAKWKWINQDELILSLVVPRGVDLCWRWILPTFAFVYQNIDGKRSLLRISSVMFGVCNSHQRMFWFN